MKKTVMLLAAALLLPLGAAGQEEQPAQALNKKNLVIKEWNSDAKGSHKELDHVTTYNAEGRKIEEIEYSGGSQKWRKRYEHGPSGKVSRELVYDGRNRLQTVKKFEYNEFARKKVQYTYNAKGKLIGIKQFEYIAQDGR